MEGLVNTGATLNVIEVEIPLYIMVNFTIVQHMSSDVILGIGLQLLSLLS